MRALARTVQLKSHAGYSNINNSAYIFCKKKKEKTVRVTNAIFINNGRITCAEESRFEIILQYEL